MIQKPGRSKRLYHWTRQLHLYLGIFISPLLLVFAVSTIFLNHGVTPKPIIEDFVVPIEVEEGVEGEALVADVLGQLQVSGEVVGRGQIQGGKTVIRVTRPGHTKIITVDIAKQEASISARTFGLIDTIRYLHLNPGPHKHPNWMFSKMWGWVADSTVYITLFLTLTGIYLWAVLKTERKAGVLALGSGALVFVATLYALLVS